jgi:hypothetical protein
MYYVVYRPVDGKSEANIFATDRNTRERTDTYNYSAPDTNDNNAYYEWADMMSIALNIEG